MINSGEDATLDSIISIVIIKSGIEMLKDMISQILGEKNDPELVKRIKNTVSGFPDYTLQVAMDTDFVED